MRSRVEKAGGEEGRVSVVWYEMEESRLVMVVEKLREDGGIGWE